MSISDVTYRFLRCLDKLVDEGKVRSKRHFALSLEYHPQGISEMIAYRRDVPLELIEKAVATYRFNPHYLFSGTGNLFSNPQGDDGLRLRNLTIITDHQGTERILHVPIPAQAGYGENLQDPVFMQSLPSYQLPDPQFRSGTYRSFEISGRSMEPSFRNNDIVIASFIEPRFWEQALKNHQVFILVTQSEVVIKSILNKIKSDKHIECISENPEFDPYTIGIDQIEEIWKVRMKITSHLQASPAPVNTNMITEQLQAQHKMLENLEKHFAKSSLVKT